MQNQVFTFLIFILNGLLIGIIFDIFRILRKSFKTPDFITYIEDIMFGILTGLLLVYSTLKFNNGELRIYIFLGIIIGLGLYLLLFSKIFIKVSVYIILTVKKVIYLIIIKPIFFIYKFIRKSIFKPFVFICINMKNNIFKFMKSLLFSFKKYKIKKDLE